MTSKRQLTLPKALAERYGIDPGDEVDWEAAGDAIRVVPSRRRPSAPTARLKLFDQATSRQQERQRKAAAGTVDDRGWTREELYERRPR